MLRKLIAGLMVAWALCAPATAMQGYNINGSISTAQMTLSGVGATPCVAIYSPLVFGGGSSSYNGPAWLQPAVLVYVSAGASLTYSVEVTGDDLTARGYSQANGNWVAFTGLSGQTNSIAATLGAAVTCVRLHVTAYTSGSAFIEVVQMVGN